MTVCLPIKLDSKASLSDDEAAQVAELSRACKAADGYDPCLNFDTHLNAAKEMPAWILAWASPAAGTRTCGEPAPSGRGCRDCRMLVGAASAFSPGMGEAEISACVAPMFRRQGIFSAMYRGIAPAAVSAGIGSILLVSEGDSPAGEAVAAHMAAALARSEYRMALKGRPAKSIAAGEPIRLVPVDETTIEEAVAIASSAFGESASDARSFALALLSDPRREQFLGRTADGFVGTVSLTSDEEGAQIHGLGVLPASRKKGYGLALLDAAVAVLKGRGAHSIRLEVEADNGQAMSIYRKRGFVDEGRVDYWRVPR